MRIDLSNAASSQLSIEQDAQKVSNPPGDVSAINASEDRTTFTSDSATVAPLVQNAMSSPEIRQNLVDQLKQSISSGQYKLDPSAIASAMIDEHA